MNPHDREQEWQDCATGQLQSLRNDIHARQSARRARRILGATGAAAALIVIAIVWQPRNETPATTQLKCSEVAPLLTAYVADELPLTTRRQIEAHLAYCSHCRAHLEHWQPVAGSRRRISGHDLASALRSLYVLGVRGGYRRAFWRFLLWTLRHYPGRLPKALKQAGAGHHFITDTREVVLPRLKGTERALEEPMSRRAEGSGAVGPAAVSRVEFR